jgi:hypothetical protein
MRGPCPLARPLGGAQPRSFVGAENPNRLGATKRACWVRRWWLRRRLRLADRRYLAQLREIRERSAFLSIDERLVLHGVAGDYRRKRDALLDQLVEVGG